MVTGVPGQMTADGCAATHDVDTPTLLLKGAPDTDTDTVIIPVQSMEEDLAVETVMKGRIALQMLLIIIQVLISTESHKSTCINTRMSWTTSESERFIMSE